MARTMFESHKVPTPSGRGILVSKIVKVGGQPVSIVGGVRYWMDSPDTGPRGFGGRLGMTFLFPAR